MPLFGSQLQLLQRDFVLFSTKLMLCWCTWCKKNKDKISVDRSKTCHQKKLIQYLYLYPVYNLYIFIVLCMYIDSKRCKLMQVSHAAVRHVIFIWKKLSTHSPRVLRGSSWLWFPPHRLLPLAHGHVVVIHISLQADHHFSQRLDLEQKSEHFFSLF